MKTKDIESFEKYMESKPEHYFGLDIYSKAHDRSVWLDALKFERDKAASLVEALEHILTYKSPEYFDLKRGSVFNVARDALNKYRENE